MLVCLDRLVAGWLGAWLAGYLDGWMDGWIDGWMDGWLSRKSAGGNDHAEGLAVENSLKNERTAY